MKTIEATTKIPGKRKSSKTEVKAHKVKGCLAITYTNLRDAKAGWSITHLPTGMSIRACLTLKQALLIIKCLDDPGIAQALEGLTAKTSKAWAKENSDFIHWLSESVVTLESWVDFKFRVRSERQAHGLSRLLSANNPEQANKAISELVAA